MTSAPVEPGSSASPHSEDFLHRSARRGSALALLQTIAGKATTIGAQYALAWLLLPAQNGLATFALSINGLLIFFNPLMLSDVLLARRSTFARNAAPAFWSTMLLALATTVILVALAVPFERWNEDKVGLAALLVVLAFRPIAMALQVVPYTALRSALRFGSITRSNVMVAVGSMILGITLGATGCGPYAIVLPPMVALLVSAILFSRAARPLPDMGFRLDGAKPLLKGYAILSGGQYAHTISLLIDGFTLGAVTTMKETGYYALAYNLSIQINSALAYNISLALQPVFAHLSHDPPAQLRSFLRNTAGIAVFTTPICALQAVLAGPFVHLFFPERWWPAAPLMTLLSIGQLFCFAMGCSASLLKAQGRFSTYSWWQTIASVLLVPAVILAAWLGGPMIEARFGIENGSAVAVALVISTQLAISIPIGAWLAVKGSGGRKRDVVKLFAQPFIPAIVGSAVSWPLLRYFPDTRIGSLAACAVITVVFGIVYLAVLRLVARNLYFALINNAKNGVVRAVARASQAIGGGGT